MFKGLNMSEQLYNDIDNAVTTICRANDTPSKLSNGVASVFYDGIRIANGNGFDWIDGEGFSSAYYDAAIKGMKHTLYAERRPDDVRDFFSKFFGG